MTPIKFEFLAGSVDDALHARVADEVAGLLAGLRLRPTSARGTLVDENGPKGGRAIRCALEVRLPRRPAVHVEATATTPRLAFDGALGKLERQLTRLRDTGRELKRRPTKYFVAKRVATR